MKIFFRPNKSLRAVTMIELLIVASLITLVGTAIYNALTNGIRIWEKSRSLVIEENVAIFFDKLSQDLHNIYNFSNLRIEGSEIRLRFPTTVNTFIPDSTRNDEGQYITQLGEIEYYLDLTDKTIYRSQANYSQSQNNTFEPPQPLVTSVDTFKLRYYYLERTKEIYTNSMNNIIPQGVEVTIEFTDSFGKKKMKKFIDIYIDA